MHPGNRRVDAKHVIDPPSNLVRYKQRRDGRDGYFPPKLPRRAR
jgi:hypothetical protein